MDAINPNHYRQNNIECIEVTQHYGFCLGNAIKYIWRLGLKDDPLQDAKKSLWYITYLRNNKQLLNNQIMNAPIFAKIFKSEVLKQFNAKEHNYLKRWHFFSNILEISCEMDIIHSMYYVEAIVNELKYESEKIK